MITSLLQGLEQVFGWLLSASWQASVLALLVLVLQWTLRGRLNPRWRYALWLLVLLRLVLPVEPESALSLFQFTPPAPDAIIVPVTEPLFVETAAIATPIDIPYHEPAYPFSFYSLLSVIWLVGALALLLLTWQVNRRFARQIGSSPEITDPELLHLFAEAKIELGIRRSIRLIENGQVQSPAIMGLFQPTLLLPADVQGKFDATELRLIFLHELAHLKRGDVIAQGVIALLQILHWFNPVLWFAFRRMRIDREPATDALVLSRTGEAEKERYGLMLIKLLEHFNQRHSLPTLVGILEDKDQFKRRFSLIAKFTQGAYGWSLLGVLLIGILAAACLTKSKKIESKAIVDTPETPTNDVGANYEGIAAMVNNRPILWSDITSDQLYSRHLKEAKANGDKRLEQFVVQEAIDQELVVQSAEASGFNVQDTIDEKVAFAVKGFGGSKEAFVENLKKNGLSLEQFTEQVRRNETYGHMYGVKVSDPARAHRKDLIDHRPYNTTAASREAITKEENALYQAENRKLQNEWNDWVASLRGKADIEIFKDSNPSPQGTDGVTGVTANSTEANTPSQTTGATTTQTPDVSENAPVECVRISTHILRIGEADYQANRDEIDAAVRNANFASLQKYKSFHLFAEPTVLVESGVQAVVENVRVCPYPAHFEKLANGIMAPTELKRQDLGATFVVVPTIVGDRINIKGELTLSSLNRWTRLPDTTYQPNFHIRKLTILQSFTTGETKGFQVPGGAQMEPDDLMAYFPHDQPPDESKNPRTLCRAFLILTALATTESGQPISLTGNATDLTNVLSVRTYLSPPHFFYGSTFKDAIVQRELTAKGVKFPPGAAATLLSDSGKLVVRNTPEQLDLVAKLIDQAEVKNANAAFPFPPRFNDSGMTPKAADGSGLDIPTQLSIVKPMPDKYAWAAASPSSQNSTGAPPNAAQDPMVLKKELLMAKQDADARRVLVNSVKDLPDDQFLATLAGLGRSDPTITALQSDITIKNAEIKGLVKSGVTEKDSRIQSLQAELGGEQEQMKTLIPGLRRAMTVDSQMADSRVTALTREIAETSPSGTPAAVAAPDKSSAEELTDLKQKLLQAKEDADARRVLLDQVKNLPDDQFLATLAGLGKAVSDVTTLQTDINNRKADIENLLKDGFAANHPRVYALQAELAVKEQQLKTSIAGLHRAMTIDNQMADSRVVLLQKEVDGLKASTLSTGTSR